MSRTGSRQAPVNPTPRTGAGQGPGHDPGPVPGPPPASGQAPDMPGQGLGSCLGNLTPGTRRTPGTRCRTRPRTLTLTGSGRVSRTGSQASIQTASPTGRGRRETLREMAGSVRPHLGCFSLFGVLRVFSEPLTPLYAHIYFGHSQVLATCPDDLGAFEIHSLRRGGRLYERISGAWARRT